MSRIDELNKQRAALGKAFQEGLISKDQFLTQAASSSAELLRLKEAEATTVAKTVLSKAEVADQAAKATSAVKDKISSAKDALKDPLESVTDKIPDDSPLTNLLDTATGNVKELTSNITSKLPKGLQNVADSVVGNALDPQGIIGSTVGELKTLESNFKDVTGLFKKKNKKTLADFTSPGDSPQNIIDNAAKGELKTFVFPEDYSPELCFRLDFIEFNRQNVFKPIKAEPKATFVFPLPKSISVGQGVAYSETELGVTGDVEARIRTNVEKNFETYGDVAGTVLKEIGGAGATALYRGALQTDIGKAGSLALGFVPNPHLSAIFNGVSRRKFSFAVQLAPKSQQESELLQNILDHYRSYMLPAMSENFITLDYPHEVAISFSEAGSSLVEGGNSKTPLDRIFKFKRCICENVTINVNDQAGQSFFQDHAPTHVTVNFQFSEVQIQVANDYGHKPAAKNADDFTGKIGSTAEDLQNSLGSYFKSDEPAQENPEEAEKKSFFGLF